jgi:ADP-ribose pyrophosphatase
VRSVESGVTGWRRTSTRIVYENPYVRAHEDILRTPRGARFTSFRLESPRFSCVVPVTHDGRIVLVRNYRPAVHTAVLELPGGRVEPGETPGAAAARELEEETGYRAGRLTPLGWFYPSPARMTSRGFLFLGRPLRAGHRRLDVTEDLENVELPIERVYRDLRAGRIHEAGTMAGLALAEPYLRRPSRAARSKRLIPRVAGRGRSGVG